MKKSGRKATVTSALVESIALTLGRTTITAAHARALAPSVGRLNDAALTAADETDFNDEPARLTPVLAQLKSPPARR